jgi:hypothetical protein
MWRESEDDLDRGLVGDDVPGAPKGRLHRARLGRIERARRERHVAHALDLEGAQGGARLVPAHQVQGVGLQRRLDEVGPDGGSPPATAGLVTGRLVIDGHDPTLGPRLGQQPHVTPERLVPRLRAEGVERAIDVRPELSRQAFLELLKRGCEVGIVLVGVARHEAGRQHHGHGL